MSRAQTIYEMLGAQPNAGRKPVLIPIPRGEKGPNFKGWQETTWEKTQDEDYQARLESGNVGVLLGSPSGGLCAIDVDDDLELEIFLDHNPALMTSLTTRGARGAQIWCWMQADPYLKNLGQLNYPAKIGKIKNKESNADWGEWRTNGGQSVISGIHPTGKEYSVINDFRPIEISFSEIIWPSHLTTPWQDEINDRLKAQFGPAWILTPQSAKQLCDMYWCGRFAVEHRVLFEAGEKEFYLYNPTTGAWHIKSDDEIKYLFSIAAIKWAVEIGEERFLGNTFRGNRKLADFINGLKGPTTRRDVFNQDYGIVHLANGMLDLNGEKPVLKPYSYKYYTRNPVPIAYDPDADCPKFKDILLAGALDAIDITLIQKWAGCLLLGHNLLQRFLILEGTAGGGKSTLVNVFQAIIGQHNCAQLRTDQLRERFELAAYIGKTFLVGVDVPGNFMSLAGASVIKGLVGGDHLQAEIKGVKRMVDLEGNYNICITCNSQLRVNLESDHEAWRRRIFRVRYERKPTDKPIRALDKILIKEESSGILNWMVQGAIMCLDQVAQGGGIVLHEKHQKAIDNLLAASDSVVEFLKQGVREAPECDVTVEELTEGYFEFCAEQSWPALSRQAFMRELSNQAPIVLRVNSRNDIERGGRSRRGYKDIAII